MREYPRVLLLGNECISKVSSNGRTLRNFLVGWPKEKIAQFCIRNTAPDYDICDQYYYVPDRQALSSFLKGVPASGEMYAAAGGIAPAASHRSRNAVTMMIRNTVWNSMRWAGTGFFAWVEAFNPEVLLLQAGDSAFMLDLARKLQEKYQIPLVIYNSEGFYFKEKDYFRTRGIRKLLYPAFLHQFRRAFDKCIRVAACSIYCCDKLKTDYDRVFGLPSDVIYTVTQMEPAAAHENEPLRIAYLGNLSLNRHKSLIEIAQVLQQISPKLKLDVYGQAEPQVQQELESCSGIVHHGFVTYDQVVQVMHSSDILVHAECFDDFYREDLKYAFSTKIADSLGSGTCFMIYAMEELACVEYLSSEEAAWVVSRKEDLRPVLEQLCSDPEARNRYLHRAIRLVQENHSQQKSTGRFQKILCDCAKR